ncbi:transporter substrate-binding domain-containing protein [Sulfurospirillum diekertiae]|uniref:substrate-binding periplasmic protein n=1 Tax=Sulfurospirillum diekertiae TaxID=1854492 RepID=UPI00142770BA|nr:transporter substrate-binding domain-containing protein [Sulfurospirillum diekertiae]QIR77665.1 transporter substrate-binding domain-containing protein [Sulfurospirillum diekertiae]
MKSFFLLFLLCFSLSAEVFKVYTEQNPPYNFLENGKVKGQATLLLEQLFQKSGHTIFENNIYLLPWTIGYHEVLNKKNTMIYSMARIHEREALFQWVGPIGKMTLGVIAKKSKHMIIASPDALHSYKIATIPGTSTEKALFDIGFRAEELDRFANLTSQLKKLKENRVDAIAFGVEAVWQLLREMGNDLSEYEVVYVLKESDLYFAFSKETNTKLIAELNETLKTLLK